jgi:LmbE family N-acetylglucosaminyl deacetylase
MVISPHLDDAVFGCGDVLADNPGSRVVTIFSGRPTGYTVPTEWDRAAGFEPGQDVVSTRRREDRDALALLRARPVWLPFLDRQYGPAADLEDIVPVLQETVEAHHPANIIVPLGLWHDDHRLAHAACRRLMPLWPQTSWLVYADAIYRRFLDSNLAGRLADLRAAGIRPLAVGGSRAVSARKRSSVACYRSQLLALGQPGRPGHADAFEPEWLWWLAT